MQQVTFSCDIVKLIYIGVQHQLWVVLYEFDQKKIIFHSKFRSRSHLIRRCLQVKSFLVRFYWLLTVIGNYFFDLLFRIIIQNLVLNANKDLNLQYVFKSI